MSSKEMPEFKPIQKEERDKMEGEPISEEEMMAELETEAGEVLPRGRISPESAAELVEKSAKALAAKGAGKLGEIAEEGKEQLASTKELFEEHNELLVSLAKVSREIKELGQELPGFLEKSEIAELIHSHSFLGATRNTLIDLYKLSDTQRSLTRRDLMVRINETLFTEVCIMEEVLFRAKEEKRRKESEEK